MARIRAGRDADSRLTMSVSFFGTGICGTNSPGDSLSRLIQGQSLRSVLCFAYHPRPNNPDFFCAALPNDLVVVLVCSLLMDLRTTPSRYPMGVCQWVDG